MTDNGRGDEIHKESAFQEILNAYLGAVADVASVLDRYRDVHFYCEKDGWDDSLDPHTNYVNQPMEAADLLDWMYKNVCNGKCDIRPYMWTDDELKLYRNNRDLAKVDDWKQTIECYRKQIEKYERKIEEATKNAAC